MKNRGDWERYSPSEPIPFVPPNTLFCRRLDDGVDWYVWSRLFWEIGSEGDTSGTIKVMVIDNIVATITSDVTRLPCPDRFSLFELEHGDVVPEIRWQMIDGEFVNPETIEHFAPITRRQLRLTLVRNGVSLSSVEEAISAMPAGLSKEEAQIEWADASEFRRDHPTLLLIATALNLTTASVDAMWRQAMIA